MIVKRMLWTSDIVERLAFQPVTARLARLLLDHSGEEIEEYEPRNLTLEGMVARGGTTLGMICRQLYHFVDKGAIQISRMELLITDRSLLEEMAEIVKG